MTKYSWYFSIIINHILIMEMTLNENHLHNLHTSFSAAFLKLLKIFMKCVFTYLLINTKYPCLDVCIVVMRNVVNCEYWAILFGVSTLWPERRIILQQEKRSWNVCRYIGRKLERLG
jgi:hypothetical protein